MALWLFGMYQVSLVYLESVELNYGHHVLSHGEEEMRCLIFDSILLIESFFWLWIFSIFFL